MELRHMRYFVAVAEELHFGRAAERLYITQPGLSAQISALEDELGARLLDRSTRRVRLTEAGEAFLEGARRTLDQSERAVFEAGRAAGGEVGRLGVGLVGPASLGFFSTVLAAFGDGYPDVELELREMNTTEQLGALREGRIQVGILCYSVDDEELDDAFEARGVPRDEMVAALPKGHALASSPRVGLAALAEEPLVIVSRDLEPHPHDRIKRLFRDEGLSPEVAQEAGGLQILLGLVSEGVGVALVPAAVRSVKHDGVAYRRIRERPPSVGMTLAWRRDERSPVLGAFLDVFAEVSRRACRED